MRPSRIIVGEVRGSEAIDMLQSLNTGHCGASTGHSNSPKDMLSRIETMVLTGMEIPISAVQRQIASGIDIIVQLGRLRDKSRKVLQIVEVLGYEDGEIKLQTLYEFHEEQVVDGKIKGEWVKVNEIQHFNLRTLVEETRRTEKTGLRGRTLAKSFFSICIFFTPCFVVVVCVILRVSFSNS